MSRKKIILSFVGPILPGSISTANSTCGKSNCACKADPPQLHGTYYRWTGVVNGKRTTKTISEKTAKECLKRIENYRKLKKKMDDLLKSALKEAPWLS
jgi:hypothetical protein